MLLQAGLSLQLTASAFTFKFLTKATPPERKCLAGRKCSLALKKEKGVRRLPAKHLPSRPLFLARGRSSARAVA